MKCGVMGKMIKVAPYENKMNTFIRRLPKLQETNHKLTQLRGLVKDEPFFVSGTIPTHLTSHNTKHMKDMPV